MLLFVQVVAENETGTIFRRIKTRNNTTEFEREKINKEFKPGVWHVDKYDFQVAYRL